MTFAISARVIESFGRNLSFPSIICPEKIPRSLALSIYFARSEDASTSSNEVALLEV